METKVTRTRFSKLSITKPIEVDGEKPDTATLTWSTRNGYPRMTAYTSNNKASSPDGKMDFNFVITAPFDYITLQIFLEYLKEVIDSTGEIKYSIDCFNTKFVNHERTNEVELQAKVIVGKDKEGVVYLAALEEGKRNVKFDLLPSSKWFKFYDATNTEITDKKVLSKLYATGYYNVLSKLLLDAAKDELVRTESTTVPSKSSKAKTIDVSGADSFDILF